MGTAAGESGSRSRRWVRAGWSIARRALFDARAREQAREAAWDPRRPRYCLHCWAPLPLEQEMRQDCNHCTFANTPELRTRFWNRDPVLVRVEIVAKVMVAVMVPLIVFSHPIAGVVAAVLAWLAVSTLTRRLAGLWPSRYAAVALAGLALVELVRAEWRGALLLLLAAVAAPAIGWLGARWRERKAAAALEGGARSGDEETES
jgi:hypothetical protein